MNFDDAWQATITRAQARKEIKLHDARFSEFLAEVGDKATYTGAEVLGWLGY